MSKKEKMYIYGVIILLIALIIKSVYLDEVKNLTIEEAMFKEHVSKIIEEEYKSFFTENNIIGFRIVKVKKIEDEGVSIIEVKDENTNTYKQTEISGVYKGKVRKYLFYLIPYGEFSVLSRK